MGVSSVLVAVSGESSDAQAVELACELLDSRKGRLHILYIIEIERRFPVDAEIAPATAKGEEVLSRMEKLAKSRKCRTEAELLQARQAGPAVVQEAVDKNVDLIVLGCLYKEAYGSFSLNYVIPYVLKNAPCRVIVWRDSVPQVPSDTAVAVHALRS